MSYDKPIAEQIVARYNWLKKESNFNKKDDTGERTPQYHNLCHLEAELRMCERILLRQVGKEKIVEMLDFVHEAFRRLEQG